METLNEFLSELPVRKLQPGEVLMHQGGTDKQVFLLKNGAVEVLKDGVSITEVSEDDRFRNEYLAKHAFGAWAGQYRRDLDRRGPAFIGHLGSNRFAGS